MKNLNESDVMWLLEWLESADFVHLFIDGCIL